MIQIQVITTITGNFKCNIINIPTTLNKTYTFSLIIPGFSIVGGTTNKCATSINVSNTSSSGTDIALNCINGFTNISILNGVYIVQQIAVIYANSSSTPFAITSIGTYYS
jgi:hypothetical protein